MIDKSIIRQTGGMGTIQQLMIGLYYYGKFSKQWSFAGKGRDDGHYYDVPFSGVNLFLVEGF